MAAKNSTLPLPPYFTEQALRERWGCTWSYLDAFFCEANDVYLDKWDKYEKLAHVPIEAALENKLIVLPWDHFSYRNELEALDDALSCSLASTDEEKKIIRQATLMLEVNDQDTFKPKEWVVMKDTLLAFEQKHGINPHGAAESPQPMPTEAAPQPRKPSTSTSANRGVKDVTHKGASDFISIDEALTRMANLDGSTYQDAAKAYFRIRATSLVTPPQNWLNDDYMGYCPMSMVDREGNDHWSNAWNCITFVKSGKRDQVEGHLQYYGFLKSEVFRFLRLNGMDIATPEEKELFGEESEDLQQELRDAIERIDELESQLAALEEIKSQPTITGPTFDRLVNLINAFEDKRYRPKQMNLGGSKPSWGIRDELRALKLAKGEREAWVFGTILKEHFKF